MAFPGMWRQGRASSVPFPNNRVGNRPARWLPRAVGVSCGPHRRNSRQLIAKPSQGKRKSRDGKKSRRARRTDRPGRPMRHEAGQGRKGRFDSHRPDCVERTSRVVPQSGNAPGDGRQFEFSETPPGRQCPCVLRINRCARPGGCFPTSGGSHVPERAGMPIRFSPIGAVRSGFHLPEGWAVALPSDGAGGLFGWCVAVEGFGASPAKVLRSDGR